MSTPLSSDTEVCLTNYSHHCVFSPPAWSLHLHPGGVAGVVLHQVDVQVGGGVEHRQQVGDLSHPVYEGRELRVKL